MGTSNSYGGAGGGTPLIPTWLTPDSDGQPQPSDGPETPGAPIPPAPGQIPPPPKLVPVPPSGDPKRFSTARGNFTRFVTSGGRDRRSLGRSLSSYVSTAMGGGGTAAKRMALSSRATSRLANFLSTASTAGVREALRSVGLERLAGRPASEVLRGLIEFICPPGGTIDESIAREAFIETVADLAESGIPDLETLTAQQMQTVLELNIAHAIEARICNDIGTNAVALPASAEAAAEIQEQLFDFVLRSVADAFSASPLGQGLTPQQTQAEIDHIYEQAFWILQTLAEAEADKR